MGIRTLVIIKSRKIKTALYAVLTLMVIYFSFAISKPIIAYTLAKNAEDLSSFKKAVSLDPQNDSLYFKYHQFIIKQTGKGLISPDAAYNNAVDAIDKAIQLNPHKTDYIMAKGWLMFRRKDYQKAHLLFKEACLREPHNHRVHLIHAYALFWQGLHETDRKKKDALLKKGLIYYQTAAYLSTHIHLYSIIKNESAYKILRDGLKKEGIIIE